MSKKRATTGWIGKKQKFGFRRNKHGEICLSKIQTSRWNRGCWNENHWPPRKVKITIEEIKGN